MGDQKQQVYVPVSVSAKALEADKVAGDTIAMEGTDEVILVPSQAPQDYLLVNNIRQSGGFKGFDQVLKTLKEGPCPHPDVRLEKFSFLDYKEKVRKAVLERIKTKAPRNVPKKTEEEKLDEMAEKIFQVLIKKRYRRGPSANHAPVKAKYVHQIKESIQKKEKIQIVFPSFPVKSYNPLKSDRKMPDLAEVACLLRCYEIALEIEQIYSVGAEIVLVLDGLVYQSIFQEPLGVADKYADTTRNFIKELEMDELIKVIDMTECIAQFPEDFKKEKKVARELVEKRFNSGTDKAFWDELVYNTAANINLTMYSREVLRYIFFQEPCLTIPKQQLEEIRSHIFKRAEIATLDYATFLQAINRADVVMKCYPKSLRVTCHQKVGQICLHLIAKESTINFPWNSVGVLNERGEFRNIFEDIVRRDSRYYAVYIGQEKYPFYYQKIKE